MTEMQLAAVKKARAVLLCFVGTCTVSYCISCLVLIIVEFHAPVPDLTLGDLREIALFGVERLLDRERSAAVSTMIAIACACERRYPLFVCRAARGRIVSCVV